MDYKFVKTEVKAKSDFEFEGYASIFGNVDDGGDIMQAGAFAKTINENLKRVKVLYMHNVMSTIGLPSNLFEDSKGLYFDAKVSKTTLGKDVMTLIHDKVITDMSIGYNPVKWAWDEEMEVRTLQEVRLWEISPVTWGMNSLASIKMFASGSEYDTIKSELKRLEALIKGAGLSSTPGNEPPKVHELNPDVIASLIDRIKL